MMSSFGNWERYHSAPGSARVDIGKERRNDGLCGARRSVWCVSGDTIAETDIAVVVDPKLGIAASEEVQGKSQINRPAVAIVISAAWISYIRRISATRGHHNTAQIRGVESGGGDERRIWNRRLSGPNGSQNCSGEDQPTQPVTQKH